MSPFDLPPAGSPVSMPEPGGDDQRGRRGRTALVTLLAIGLVGGGIAGISQLASADEPEWGAASPSDDESVPPADDDGDGETSNDGEMSNDGETPAPPPVPEDAPGDLDIDGEIVIDTGDGEPVVIDLGDLDVGRLQECIGLPALPFDLEGAPGEWSEWEPGTGPMADLEELFGDEFLESLPAFDELPTLDGSVTVTGPDGTSIVDLGENGTVTITKDGDDIVVETEGDATVEQLDVLLGDVGELGTLFDEEFTGDLEAMLDDLLGELDGGFLDDLLGEGLPALGEMPEFEQIDPQAVDECVAEVLGR